ncbi:hypothetical protein AVEN_211297-1 [Araneus ventricosus]|uniref:Uncharacterized protein n=1 Tax=Araneus ventricosus TaxID=182803 RepID=A0A4Y2HNG7_ARAVE|nr:hypothetical protein AVEN_211297-1 [Araneus ventricosus]
MELVILNPSQMTRTTPELPNPSQNFGATPTGGRLDTTYDLACNRPYTRWIFGGIGFRACDPPVQTLPLRPQSIAGGGHNRMPLLS